MTSRKRSLFTVFILLILIGVVVFLYKHSEKQSDISDKNMQDTASIGTWLQQENEQKNWENFLRIDEETNTVIVDWFDFDAGREKTPAEKTMESLLDQEAYKDGSDIALMLSLASWSAQDTLNEVQSIYKSFADNYFAHTLAKTPVEEIIDLPAEIGMQRDITIAVKDAETRAPITWIDVWLWGWFVWETNEQGQVNLKTRLPRSHDYLYLQSDEIGYTDVFTKHSLVFRNAPTVKIEMYVSDDFSHVVKTSTDKNLWFDTDHMTFRTLESCALMDKDGDCYEGEVIVEYTYLAAWDANNLSVPMQALNDEGAIQLTSNGMAFIDFYDTNWVKLQYAKKQARVCYKVGEEDIAIWNEREPENSIQDGYRWFDETIGYWKYDQDAMVEIDTDNFCVETVHVY